MPTSHTVDPVSGFCRRETASLGGVQHEDAGAVDGFALERAVLPATSPGRRRFVPRRFAVRAPPADLRGSTLRVREHACKQGVHCCHQGYNALWSELETLHFV